ncbi:hypothetical protein X768_09895 [Mesorhizobium sp. LSJC265A00]|nr:hypothetical protein X768_09895 [Mesorhizobium sp. LSJC265A00]
MTLVDVVMGFATEKSARKPAPLNLPVNSRCRPRDRICFEAAATNARTRISAAAEPLPTATAPRMRFDPDPQQEAIQIDHGRHFACDMASIC